MRHLKQLFIQFALAVLCSITSLAQISGPTTPQLDREPVFSKDGVVVKVIDEEGLQNLLAQSQKKLRLFTIITRNCGGTPNALAYEAYLNKNYDKDVDHWILFSDKVKNASKVMERLKQLDRTGTVYIISDKYKSKVSDDRQKGTDFRNSVCQECKQDVIGVPYNILYNQKNEVIMHGYPNFEGPLAHIPSDFIGYFIKNLPTK